MFYLQLKFFCTSVGIEEPLCIILVRSIINVGTPIGLNPVSVLLPQRGPPPECRSGYSTAECRWRCTVVLIYAACNFMPVIIVPNLSGLDITGKIPTEIPEFIIVGKLVVLLYMLVYFFFLLK